MAKKKRKKNGKKKSVEKVVVDKLIELIEKDGLLPWQKPWSIPGGMFPSNFVSKKPYRGVNAVMTAFQYPTCPWWVTFKQARQVALQQARKAGRKISLFVEDIDETRYELDAEGYWVDRETRERYIPKGSYWHDEETGERWYGGVKKGERGTPIVFWKWIPKKKDGKIVRNKEGEPQMRPLLRFFTVFNLGQCVGIGWEKPTFDKNFEPDKACEEIVQSMPQPPTVKHGARGAFYYPGEDLICLPDRETFQSVSEYYSTRFHEMGHATGHKSRLNRKTLVENDYFGGHNYSHEELVAELSAVFLCAHAGIEKNVIDNSAAYLKSWLGKIKEDPKLLITSAQQAQKAVDFILDVQVEEEKDEEEEAA